MNKKEYQDRRQALMKKLPLQSFSFFFAGSPLRKSADSDYPFFTNRNFFYLTGIEEQDAVLLLIKTAHSEKEILFIRDIDETLEKWHGAYIRPRQAMEISGINTIEFLSSFDGYFDRPLNFYEITTIGIDNDVASLQGQRLAADEFADKLHSRLAAYPLFNTFGLVAGMRTIKSAAEVEAIKAGAVLTHHALEDVVRLMAPGKNERELAAAFHYHLEREGGSPTFTTIMAGGANSCTLHYISNDHEVSDGDVLLCDLGGALQGYGADISVTYPVNGTFTERQAAVYEVVLDCFKAVKAAARPGLTMADLNALTNRKLAEGMIALGLIKDASEFRKYYFHSVSHSLGLDTHDIGFTESTVLQPGMVISDEPGIYIAEEKIGIRIETDLLITEQGCEDLAPFIPREIKDVEAFIQNSKR